MGLFLAFLFAISGPLEVSVRPRFALAPTTISVIIRVARDESNRGLTLTINGPEKRSRFFQLEGEDSPSIFEDFYQIRQPGKYVINVQVNRSGKKDLRHEVEFCASGLEVKCF